METPRRRAVLMGAACSILLSGCVADAADPSTARFAPVGSGKAWTLAFDRAVPRGAVRSDGGFPGYDASFLLAYRDGTASTNGGVYRPSRVNAVAVGELQWQVPGDGVGSSVTIGPSAIGGEWSIRLRTDLISGMRIASMLWPDNDVWPGTDGSGGEIDFPEEELNGRSPYAAVVGDAGLTRDGEQLFNPATRTRTPAPWTSWHVYTIQVVPGRSVTMLQDGVVVARVTDNVPRTRIHQQVQVESITGLHGGTGTVRVSGAAYSPRLDGSSARALQP